MIFLSPTPSCERLWFRGYAGCLSWKRLHEALVCFPAHTRTPQNRHFLKQPASIWRPDSLFHPLPRQSPLLGLICVFQYNLSPSPLLLPLMEWRREGTVLCTGSPSIPVSSKGGFSRLLPRRSCHPLPAQPQPHQQDVLGWELSGQHQGWVAFQETGPRF